MQGAKDIMYAKHFSIEESKGKIYCDSEAQYNKSLQVIRNCRDYIKSYIQDYPEFELSYEPWTMENGENIPAIIQRMVNASNAFNVGPMASIAGAIVDEVFDNLGKEGVTDFLMENGGEIRVHSPGEKIIGTFTGESTLGSKIAFAIPPLSEKFSGIGTSSATIGHAFSFGKADLVTVFCENAALADAAATAICNATRLDDEEDSIHDAIEEARKFEQITGVFIVQGKHVGTFGNLPRLVKLQGDEKVIHSILKE
ncbi:MAG: UPF0280 family protein [Candidatus Hodarchaeota archaeon]